MKMARVPESADKIPPANHHHHHTQKKEQDGDRNGDNNNNDNNNIDGAGVNGRIFSHQRYTSTTSTLASGSATASALDLQSKSSSDCSKKSLSTINNNNNNTNNTNNNSNNNRITRGEPHSSTNQNVFNEDPKSNSNPLDIQIPTKYQSSLPPSTKPTAPSIPTETADQINCQNETATTSSTTTARTATTVKLEFWPGQSEAEFPSGSLAGGGSSSSLIPSNPSDLHDQNCRATGKKSRSKKVDFNLPTDKDHGNNSNSMEASSSSGQMSSTKPQKSISFSSGSGPQSTEDENLDSFPNGSGNGEHHARREKKHVTTVTGTTPPSTPTPPELTPGNGTSTTVMSTPNGTTTTPVAQQAIGKKGSQSLTSAQRRRSRSPVNNIMREIRKMSLASQDAREEKEKKKLEGRGGGTAGDGKGGVMSTSGGGTGGGGGGGTGSGSASGSGGSGSAASKAKAAKKLNRRRKRREEEYTDKDRAAAVTLGSRDIKQSLKAKKKRERKLHINMDFLHSEDFLTAMFVVEASFQSRVKKQTKAALSTLNKALELNPTHKAALVARSQCHLKLGDAASALKDAETSFDGNDTYINGLFQYAEALYNLGQFEKALIAYHRGYRIRKVESFRIGIQKSQEAIRRAIGDRSATQIEDLDQILPLIDELEALANLKQEHCCVRPGTNEEEILGKKLGSKLKPPSKARARWVAREVLGQMYFDKDYLTKFLHRPDIQSDQGASQELRSNATEALNYLEIREQFWRQQNPMYARKQGLNFNNKMVLQYEEQERERQEASRRIKIDAAEGAVLKNISLIQHALSIGRAKDCQLECDRTMRQMKEISVRLLPRKPEFMCQILHYKGLAFMKLKLFDNAAETFQQELNIATENRMQDVKGRALDHSARAYALKGSYADASEIWETRMSMAKTSLERTYLFHEIGRCYLEMNKAEIAKYYGNQSLDEASKINDTIWMMNARILLGQVEIKQMQLDQAEVHFQEAEKHAVACKNNANVQLLREGQQCLKVWQQKRIATDAVQKSTLDMTESSESTTEALKDGSSGSGSKSQRPRQATDIST